ncbi:MAG: TIGR04013 family B12-binding domain/radical SAM domain-containing protein [Desulfurococcaceae archaeon]
MLEVVFLYDKRTRYSLNSLLATIDSEREISVRLADDLDKLLKTALLLRNKGRKVLVAISLLTTMLADQSYLNSLLDTIALLKKKKCITVCGGPHASGDPLGSLVSLGFDYVVIGEGEETFRELVLLVRDGGDPGSVKGIAYLDHGRFEYTGRRSPLNLDDYHPFPYWRNMFSPIEITRGCPYGCFYCQVSYFHGNAYRHRSVDNIVFYARVFYEKGMKDLRFITPNGLAYGMKTSGRSPELDKLEELLSALKKEADRFGGRIFLGTFPSELRPDHVTEESLKILKKYVANRRTIIGGQSGSESVLRAIHRGHSVEDVINAVDISVKVEFTPDVDLILGLPCECPDDMIKTVEMARKVTEKGGRVHLHYYLPLPGTPFGLKPPQPIPQSVKRELLKLIGTGKAYGDWLKQEAMSWRIIELHRKGVIYPRSSAPSFISGSDWGS